MTDLNEMRTIYFSRTFDIWSLFIMILFQYAAITIEMDGLFGVCDRSHFKLLAQRVASYACSLAHTHYLFRFSLSLSHCGLKFVGKQHNNIIDYFWYTKEVPVDVASQFHSFHHFVCHLHAPFERSSIRRMNNKKLDKKKNLLFCRDRSKFETSLRDIHNFNRTHLVSASIRSTLQMNTICYKITLKKCCFCYIYKFSFFMVACVSLSFSFSVSLSLQFAWSRLRPYTMHLHTKVHYASKCSLLSFILNDR